MDFGLKGRRALVTGSTAGIGLATARALAAEGASVTVNGRTQARVDSAVNALKGELPGATITGIAADLSRSEGCEFLIGQLPDIDVLVNNLGIFEPKAFEQISDADWVRFFETNVLSGVRLSRPPQWQLEMQEFLEMSSPFVIVYDQLSMQETPEDFKQRGLWLKNHKDELNQLCKAIICIEPDQEKRVAIRKMTEMAVKAFGIPYEIVDTREDAERIADELTQV